MADKKSLLKILTILLSVILPGLGQVFQRRVRTGIYIFIAFSTALGITAWYARPIWYSIPALIWLWNIWDAAALPKGKGAVLPILLWLIMAYGIGSQVTEFNLKALVDNATRSRSIIAQMFRLDFTQPKTEKLEGYTDIQAPCSATPPIPDRTINGIRIYVEEPCATVGSTITVHGEGFWPNETTIFYWQNPIGGKAMQETAVSDANGNVTLVWKVLPIVHTTAPDPTVPQIHRIKVSQSRPIGGIELSDVGGYIIQGIYETLALAFLSTIIGAILAIPFAFLAARNLMTGNPVTTAIFLVTRTVLNIVRSIEALIMAIIFVIIVGLGPFPGMIALTIHTTAALGKLFSEVIEGIDPGPIEAVRATGATWVQVVRYAVIPQVVPAFTGLTIYRWDINVRSSTIIGFVGGGGIGFFLWQWIVLQDFRAVGTAFVAIAVVVMLMDFLSARIRERLV
ncbi:MAG TPA: phosphonate ABC transporter, permease protein PhnE [Anaerolineaceae bacterium]|nr:phosphonate ABC transporter, permease protein PhnE [Anaerolineaceae bacterium]